MKVPRKILIKKLTEFVSKCKNEEALDSFFTAVLNVTSAKWNNNKIIVTSAGETIEYTQEELVSHMLDYVEDQSIIREQVSRIKKDFLYTQTK